MKLPSKISSEVAKNSQNKGLFLITHQLYPTVISSQVIVVAKALQQYAIEVEIWCLAFTEQQVEKSYELLNQSESLSTAKIRILKGFPTWIPFSGLLNSVVLYLKIRKNRINYDWIHVRADYGSSLFGYFSKIFFFKPPVIWDCRGDTEAEFCLKYNQNTISHLLMRFYGRLIIKWRVFLASKTCQAAIFVSEELKELKGKNTSQKSVKVIPCFASSKLFFFDSEIRKTYRDRLELNNDDLLITYSGSFGSYQLFPESVTLFEQLYKLNSKYKLLVLTPYLDEASTLLSRLPTDSYLLLSVPIQEVNSYLNASDFSLLLRMPDPVNLVASPVKFAEYCLAGLPVIMTKAISQSYKIAKDIGNLIEYDLNTIPKDFSRLSDSQRYALSSEAQKILSLEENINNYLHIYQFLTSIHN